MTKKDFVLLADMIRNSYNRFEKNEDYSAAQAIEFLAYELSKKLGSTNENFDKDRFLIACGVHESSRNR
jgi:hypothetical protein